MKILKQGAIPPETVYPKTKQIECCKCHSLLEVDYNDINFGYDGPMETLSSDIPTITCPFCNCKQFFTHKLAK